MLHVYLTRMKLEDIKFNIENVVYSSEKINDLKNRGFERSKLFTWTKCANETLNIYKEDFLN